MPRLLFTEKKTSKSVGFTGGNLDLNEDLHPKIPDTNNYQTHLCTLLPDFFKNTGTLKDNQRISIFISLEKHQLGGVKESLTSRFTVNQPDDLLALNKGYSKAILYDVSDTENEKFSNCNFQKKYFELIPNDNEYYEKEHLFFEENGMGLDISKQLEIPYFEQDPIYPSPKYQHYLQLLEEDIENDLHIFQNGIGYIYLDKNIKRLKSGDEAGLFFIQNT